MADSIPAALRQADINIWKCATKAAQLQTVKPIMAYWCEYWAVNQILAKQLHTANEDILRYTTSLMDKLEQTKAEYADEDAVTDDAAGQAYVEQFAQETLDRAERVVRANRVTQQTATTFDAAATFFHVANIWGPVDQETQQKIKYAKWNAARIIKAIKEGKDPNESNPKREESQEQPLDPNDPAVQALAGTPSSVKPRPVTVEDAPDADLPRDAAGVSLPHSPASVGPSPISDAGELKLPGVPTGLNRPAPTGHFGQEPAIPSPSNPSPDLPVPPTDWAPTQPSPEPRAPPTAWSQPPASPPVAFNFQQQQPSAPPAATIPPTFATNQPSTAAVASPPVNPPTGNPYDPSTGPSSSTSAYQGGTAATTSQTTTSYRPVQQPSGNFAVDEAAMLGAQKHAKWAISALNFEDVPTAVRELRRALELLGAT
ncbi:hypothetical protein VTK26DRAFT_2625 [Humicola hyalothermophila]